MTAIEIVGIIGISGVVICSIGAMSLVIIEAWGNAKKKRGV